MISKETPIGSKVRVYVSPGEEATAWTGKTASLVDKFVSVTSEDGFTRRVAVSQVEPIGAKPFINHKIKCPSCHHEFER